MLSSTAVFSEETWVLRKDAEGIVVYTRRIPGTEFSQFRAVTRLKTTLFSVLALWADPSTYTTWMFNCKEGAILKTEGNLDLYAYIVTAVPWPLQRRDDILFAHTTQDEATGKITIELTARPDFIPHRRDIVRILRAAGKVELTPLENGEIEIVFEFYMDPGGMVPAPIVNLTLVDFPFFSLKNLRQEALKPQYREVRFDFFKNSN